MHRITNVDWDARIGDCSECGPGVRLEVRVLKTGVRKRKCFSADGERRAKRLARLDKLHRKHGLTAAEALAYVAGKSCAICDKTETLVVDHDHDTGAIRGVLCRRCNLGLGHFNDDLAMIDRARAYLIG